MEYVNGMLVASAVGWFIGFCGYTMELIQGRVKVYTKWSELSSHQLDMWVLCMISAITGVGTLIYKAAILG